jgi:hypothetical protein
MTDIFHIVNPYCIRFRVSRFHICTPRDQLKAATDASNASVACIYRQRWERPVS